MIYFISGEISVVQLIFLFYNSSLLPVNTTMLYLKKPFASLCSFINVQVEKALNTSFQGLNCLNSYILLSEPTLFKLYPRLNSHEERSKSYPKNVQPFQDILPFSASYNLGVYIARLLT